MRKGAGDGEDEAVTGGVIFSERFLKEAQRRVRISSMLRAKPTWSLARGGWNHEDAKGTKLRGGWEVGDGGLAEPAPGTVVFSGKGTVFPVGGASLSVRAEFFPVGDESTELGDASMEPRELSLKLRTWAW